MTGQTNLKLATLVNINLTEFPIVAWLTDTPHIVDEIQTATVVLTRGLAIRGMLESTSHYITDLTNLLTIVNVLVAVSSIVS